MARPRGRGNRRQQSPQNREIDQESQETEQEADMQSIQARADLNATKKMPNTEMINLLPKFGATEEESFEFFLEQFSQISALTAWNSAQQGIILKTRLHGEALQYLRKNPVLQKETAVTKIIEGLQKKFCPPQSTAQRQTKFNKIMYTPDKTLDQLSFEIEQGTNEFLGIKESSAEETKKVADGVKFAKFLELVPSDIRSQLRTENVQSFTAAVMRAKELNDIYNEEAHETNAILCTKQKQTEENEAIKQLNGKIAELEKRLAVVQVNTDRELTWCHVCETGTHFTKECRKLKQFREKKETYQNSRGQQRGYAGASVGRFRSQNSRSIQSWDQERIPRRGSGVVQPGQQYNRGNGPNFGGYRGPRISQTSQNNVNRESHYQNRNYRPSYSENYQRDA